LEVECFEVVAVTAVFGVVIEVSLHTLLKQEVTTTVVFNSLVEVMNNPPLVDTTLAALFSLVLFLMFGLMLNPSTFCSLLLPDSWW